MRLDFEYNFLFNGQMPSIRAESLFKILPISLYKSFPDWWLLRHPLTQSIHHTLCISCSSGSRWRHLSGKRFIQWGDQGLCSRNGVKVSRHWLAMNFFGRSAAYRHLKGIHFIICSVMFRIMYILAHWDAAGCRPFAWGCRCLPIVLIGSNIPKLKFL